MNLTIRPNVYTYKSAVSKNFKQKENIEQLYTTEKEIKHENRAIASLAGAIALSAALGMGINKCQDKQLMENYYGEKAEIEACEKQISFLEDKIDNVKSEDTQDRLEQIQFLYLQKSANELSNILDKANKDLYGSGSETVRNESMEKAQELNDLYRECRNKYSYAYIVKHIADDICASAPEIETYEDVEKVRDMARKLALKSQKEKMTPLEIVEHFSVMVSKEFGITELNIESGEFLMTAQSLYEANPDEMIEQLFCEEGKKSTPNIPSDL